MERKRTDHDHADEMMMADGRYFLSYACVLLHRCATIVKRQLGVFCSFLCLDYLLYVCNMSFSKAFWEKLILIELLTMLNV